MRPTWRWCGLLILVVGLGAAELHLGASELHAGDGEGKPAKAKHLDYRATYGEALLEARIRNLPVFVSRHKDF